MRGGELDQRHLLKGQFLKRFESLLSPPISMIKAMISKGRTCDIEYCWTLNVVGKRRTGNWADWRCSNFEEISNRTNSTNKCPLAILQFQTHFRVITYKQDTITTRVERWPSHRRRFLKLKRSSHTSGVPQWRSLQYTQSVKEKNKTWITLRLESRN